MQRMSESQEILQGTLFLVLLGITFLSSHKTWSKTCFVSSGSERGESEETA